MAQYAWNAGTTDSGLVLAAIQSVAATPKWDGSDGSYVLTTGQGGSLLVALIVPDGLDPGAGTINQANLDSALAAMTSAVTATRSALVSAAQSAVGVAIGSTTQAQKLALLAVLLYKAGAIDRNGVVQPLASWAL